jgi:hypothetical protein
MGIYLSGSCLTVLVQAIGRIALILREIGVIQIKRGTIGADDLVVRSHIEIDMWVIIGRLGTHAVEFLHADMNFLDPYIVAEMRYTGCRHDHLSIVSVKCGDAATSDQNPQYVSDRKGLFNLE